MLVSFAALLALAAGPALSQEVLPFPAPPMGGKVGPTIQQSVHKWREQSHQLPKDAPNILIVMLDDAGFGQPDTFGGEIHTPTLSRLAKEGIAYNAFHTTAMCSPTRAAISGERIALRSSVIRYAQESLFTGRIDRLLCDLQRRLKRLRRQLLRLCLVDRFASRLSHWVRCALVVSATMRRMRQKCRSEPTFSRI